MEVAANRLEQSNTITIREDEGFDVRLDARTGVKMREGRDDDTLRYSGDNGQVMVDLDPWRSKAASGAFRGIRTADGVSIWP